MKHEPESGATRARLPRPRSIWRVTAAVALALGVCAASAGAQSLGEAAKAEQARRKAVGKPAKVYTNSSLKRIPGEVIPTPPAPRPESAEPAPAGAAPSGNPPPEPPAEAEPADPASTPEYWRRRITDARNELDNNALMIDALQSRVNGLLADFTSRDDPVQRAQIASDRQKALDELARRQKQQIALEKAIADIEEEARRARIPPGWLR